MKALVTGGTGFAGRHLVDLLLSKGHQVSVTSMNSGGSTNGAELIVADLTKPAEVNKIDLRDIDAVYNLAGLAGVGASFAEPSRYLEVNSNIQINLFEACLKQDVRPSFLVVSSGNIYSPSAALPLTEESAISPRSPYAVSKLAQEIIGDYYACRDFKVITSRSFNHLGPGQLEGFIAADLAKQIAIAEKTGHNKITVGNLDSKRDYTDVRDIAEAYRLLVEKGQAGERYNICSGKAVSGHDILAGLLKSSKTAVEVVTNPDLMRPSDSAEIYGSNRKIEKDTAWQPSIPLERTLEETLEFWRQRV
jgi:GDP-4-dehydro-6-deoxy-D-mannose reductase